MKRTLGQALVAALLVIATFLGALLLRDRIDWFNPKPTVTVETSISEVVRSLKREEQVVLLSLGVQGITERTVTRKVWGAEVPGSKRTLFVQHNYRALLGIDGKQVTVKQTGPKAVEVTIPEFLFIGYNDVSFKTAVEKNGVLSWATPEIDTTNLITEILNAQTKQQHVRDNRETLEEQAKTFYGGIIEGVDPTITTTFKYTAVS